MLKKNDFSFKIVAFSRDACRTGVQQKKKWSDSGRMVVNQRMGEWLISINSYGYLSYLHCIAKHTFWTKRENSPKKIIKSLSLDRRTKKKELLISNADWACKICQFICLIYLNILKNKLRNDWIWRNGFCLSYWNQRTEFKY